MSSCRATNAKPVEYHHSEQECAFQRLADEAEKKESGPLKVGDRVEVREGVRDLVHEGAIPLGQYEVTRAFDDDNVSIQRGSVRYLVRASDVRRV